MPQHRTDGRHAPQRLAIMFCLALSLLTFSGCRAAIRALAPHQHGTQPSPAVSATPVEPAHGRSWLDAWPLGTPTALGNGWQLTVLRVTATILDGGAALAATQHCLVVTLAATNTSPGARPFAGLDHLKVVGPSRLYVAGLAGPGPSYVDAAPYNAEREACVTLPHTLPEGVVPKRGTIAGSVSWKVLGLDSKGLALYYDDPTGAPRVYLSLAP